MDVRLTWTDLDEAGDHVVPNVLSPKDLVPRPDKLYHTHITSSPKGKDRSPVNKKVFSNTSEVS